MSASRSTASGDLCDVRTCPNLGTAVADVPLFPASGSTVELALCIHHLAEMRDADDLIELARQWVLEAVRP